MLPKDKHKIMSPSALGFFFAKRYFGTMGAFVLSFMLLDLLFGSEPSKLLNGFVIPSFIATIPVVTYLVAAWPLYLIIYIYTTYPIRTASLIVERMGSYLWTQAMRYVSVLRFQSIPHVLQPASRLLIDGRRRGIPEHLATGWNPSINPQVE